MSKIAGFNHDVPEKKNRGFEYKLGFEEGFTCNDGRLLMTDREYMEGRKGGRRRQREISKHMKINAMQPKAHINPGIIAG